MLHLCVNWGKGHTVLTLMLLVANFAISKLRKNPRELRKPWHMGTHLRVLSKSFPMSTNMTGFRRFSKIFDFFVLWRKVASALEGLRFALHPSTLQFYKALFKVISKHEHDHVPFQMAYFLVFNIACMQEKRMTFRFDKPSYLHKRWSYLYDIQSHTQKATYLDTVLTLSCVQQPKQAWLF